jgi:hypothetical protein
MIQGLLRGIAPPRPLFLPIVFSPGARVENQPLPAFLANPTKICNAQRQMRGPLRTDGFSCYFDPFLEVEALGATLQREAADRPPVLHWPQDAGPGELPADLRAPEEAAKSGRVPIALDVLRRMNAIVRDDAILMAGVTGPLTLAARLAQLDTSDAWRTRGVPESAVELAASVVTRISGALVEAGASLIMIQEDFLPILTEERCAAWASALEPAFNVIRFYGALPALQLTDADVFAANAAVILRRRWDCILCPSLCEFSSPTAVGPANGCPAALGLSIPLEMFQLDDPALQVCCETVRRNVAASRPAIITTAGDVPAMTDMKRLSKILENVPRHYGE